MGAGFDDWLRGLIVLIVGFAGFFLFGWLLMYFNIALPPGVGKLLGWVIALGIAWFALGQVFD